MDEDKIEIPVQVGGFEVNNEYYFNIIKYLDCSICKYKQKSLFTN